MRTDPGIAFERSLWRGGFGVIAGLDEAGRGALAGPVAVGAVILPNDIPLLSRNRRSHKHALDGVRDSKQMTAEERESAAGRIKAVAVAWSVGFASSVEIDAQGIVGATRLAALRAVQELAPWPEYLLTDFRLELPQLDIPQTSMVRGDALCLSIAAASVLAKTARDACMRSMEDEVPGYGLGKHKGYGTLAHRLALRELGYSPIHRKTFVLKELEEEIPTPGPIFATLDMLRDPPKGEGVILNLQGASQK
jgi:ribonuclease HII